jgi:CRP/FNR family transcriptional regulator, cyclic AMP receptor protein
LHRLVALLSKNPLLCGCSEQDLSQLVRVCVAKEYSADEFVFVKGEPGEACYMVVSGHIGVGAHSVEGRYCLFSDFNPGDIFGEIAVIDGGPRTADAVAIADSRLLVIRRGVFLSLLKQNAHVSLELLYIISARVRLTSARLDELFWLDFPSRLAKRLLVLLEGEGWVEGSEGERVCRLSQNRLASIIGASRQTVNEQLRAWQREGIVHVSRESIAIRNEVRLRQIASPGTA